jgi:hypothetical protein
MLPVQLQWPDEDPAMFPPAMQYIRYYSQSLDPAFASTGHVPPGTPLFTTDLDAEPVLYAYAYDIQVALLRTRYYYAKYMVHRPYVYKALHYPDQMGPLDYQGVAECLKV